MTKRNEVIRYLLTVEFATISDIYKNVSFGYYCHENRNLSKLLSNMVRAGNIERIKNGTFRINYRFKTRITKNEINPQQTTLPI